MTKPYRSAHSHVERASAMQFMGIVTGLSVVSDVSVGEETDIQTEVNPPVAICQ